MFKQTITLTFGDQAENHVGMQKIGKLAEKGFTSNDLDDIKQVFESNGCECELVELDPNNIFQHKEDAKVLIIRNAINMILSPIQKTADDLYTEQSLLNPDTKALMRGKVVNKRARYNLCYDEIHQNSDFASGKGTVVSYNQIPITKHIVDQLPILFGDKAKDLKGEGNFYYDVTKCGIGYHGDSERKIVLAIRLGQSLPLYYQWFKRYNSIGSPVVINIDHGDLYVMSEKATGNDWKKSSIFTLRHATGCEKYTKVKS